MSQSIYLMNIGSLQQVSGSHHLHSLCTSSTWFCPYVFPSEFQIVLLIACFEAWVIEFFVQYYGLWFKINIFFSFMRLWESGVAVVFLAFRKITLDRNEGYLYGYELHETRLWILIIFMWAILKLLKILSWRIWSEPYHMRQPISKQTNILWAIYLTCTGQLNSPSLFL